MQVETHERVEVRAGYAYVRDSQGRTVLFVKEMRLEGHPVQYIASGLLLGHIDGDSLAVRTLYAADLPAAVAEARALVVREIAGHAADLLAAAAELTGGDTDVGTGTTAKPHGSDGEAVRSLVRPGAVGSDA